MAVSSTRGSQKAMSTIFYIMLFTSSTHGNLKKLHHNIAGRHICFFNVVPIFADNLLPPTSKSRHSHPVKVALCPLQSPTYGVLHCLVIGSMLFSQHCIKDQTSGNMTVRDQDCRVGAVSLLFHNWRWIVYCARSCEAQGCHGGSAYTFFFGGGVGWGSYLDEGQRSDFLVFYCRGQSSLLFALARTSEEQQPLSYPKRL